MKRRIMRALKLNEISAVTVPAQEGARFTIMKRASIDDDALAKFFYDIIAPEGADITKAIEAISFEQALADVEFGELQREMMNTLSNYWSALWRSIDTIRCDEALAAEAKLSAMQSSVLQFVNTLRSEAPQFSDDLDKALAGSPGTTPKSTKENDMDLEKKVAELETQLAAVTKKAGELEAENTTLKAANAQAKADIEKAKTDEVIKVGETEVRKSVVGDAMFAVVKQQQADIAKAEEARALVAFEKKAETDVPALPGTVTEKAAALQAIGALPEAIRKTVEAMLKSGQEAAVTSKRFTELGGGGDTPFAKAEDKLDAAVKKHATDNKMDYNKAYAAVLQTEEGRALYGEVEAARRAA